MPGDVVSIGRPQGAGLSCSIPHHLAMLLEKSNPCSRLAVSGAWDRTCPSGRHHSWWVPLCSCKQWRGAGQVQAVSHEAHVVPADMLLLADLRCGGAGRALSAAHNTMCTNAALSKYPFTHNRGHGLEQLMWQQARGQKRGWCRRTCCCWQGRASWRRPCSPGSLTPSGRPLSAMWQLPRHARMAFLYSCGADCRHHMLACTALSSPA